MKGEWVYIYIYITEQGWQELRIAKTCKILAQISMAVPSAFSVAHGARGPLQQAPKGRSPWRYLTLKNVTKMARRYRHGDGAVWPVLGAPFQLGPPSPHSRECFSHPEPSSNRPHKVDLHGGTLHLKT